MSLRTVHSEYLDKSIVIDDNCGCSNGGFIEKEFTEHGFSGVKWVRSVLVYCDRCNKELPRISEVEVL